MRERIRSAKNEIAGISMSWIHRRGRSNYNLKKKSLLYLNQSLETNLKYGYTWFLPNELKNCRYDWITAVFVFALFCWFRRQGLHKAKQWNSVIFDCKCFNCQIYVQNQYIKDHACILNFVTFKEWLQRWSKTVRILFPLVNWG